MTLTSSFDKSGRGGGKSNNPDDEKDIIFYENAGDPRNVCFIQPDGKEQVFYYADIMQQEYDPSSNSLTLRFYTASVKLTGKNMEQLRDSFRTHTVKKVRCVEKRYEKTKEETEIVVTKIELTKQ